MTSERLPDETAVEPTADPEAAVDATPPAPAQATEPTTAEASAEPASTEPVAEFATAEPSAETLEPAEAVAEPTATETAEPVAPAEPTAQPLVPSERFARARRIGRRVRPIVQIGLFVVGIAIGYTVFQMTRPIVAPESVAVVDVNATTATPPAVRDLVGALRSDDQSAVRAVLDSEPFRLISGELATRKFQKIDGVDTLSTYAHDNLAATEIVIRGENTDGDLIAINLVVHQKDNVIVSFR